MTWLSENEGQAVSSELIYQFKQEEAIQVLPLQLVITQKFKFLFSTEVKFFKQVRTTVHQ